MRMLTTAVSIAFSFGLAGCACLGSRTPASGDYLVPCNTGSASTNVSIQIEYARAGALTEHAAKPDKCSVKGSTKITWIATSEDPGNAFVLKFKDGITPDARDRMEVKSELGTSGRQEASIDARRVSETTQFRYGILANGVLSDPSIIIER